MAISKYQLQEDEYKRYTRRRRRQWLGLAVILLCIIGLGTVVYSLFTVGEKLMDRTAEMNSYETRLAPLVMLDPLEFEGIENARTETLLEAAIWACVYGEKDLSIYPRDEYGALILPAIEIDRYAAQLYGPDHRLIHDTFQANGMEFSYNEETASYTIPITSQIGIYTPKVVSISGVRLQVVTVAYMVPASGGAMDLVGTTGQVQKYMEYVFRLDQGSYYLDAIRTSPLEVTKPASSTPEQTSSLPPVVEEEDVSSSSVGNAPAEG